MVLFTAMLQGNGMLTSELCSRGHLAPVFSVTVANGQAEDDCKMSHCQKEHKWVRDDGAQVWRALPCTLASADIQSGLRGQERP